MVDSFRCTFFDLGRSLVLICCDADTIVYIVWQTLRPDPDTCTM